MIKSDRILDSDDEIFYEALHGEYDVSFIPERVDLHGYKPSTYTVNISAWNTHPKRFFVAIRNQITRIDNRLHAKWLHRSAAFTSSESVDMRVSAHILTILRSATPNDPQNPPK